MLLSQLGALSSESDSESQAECPALGILSDIDFNVEKAFAELFIIFSICYYVRAFC